MKYAVQLESSVRALMVAHVNTLTEVYFHNQFDWSDSITVRGWLAPALHEKQ